MILKIHKFRDKPKNLLIIINIYILDQTKLLDVSIFCQMYLVLSDHDLMFTIQLNLVEIFPRCRCTIYEVEVYTG